jgi:hypothetical protein
MNWRNSRTEQNSSTVKDKSQTKPSLDWNVPALSSLCDPFTNDDLFADKTQIMLDLGTRSIQLTQYGLKEAWLLVPQRNVKSASATDGVVHVSSYQS